jgi:hypothetical protein
LLNFSPPILGFDDWSPDPLLAQWRDGTVVYRGILGDMSPEALAERDYKQQLRSQGITVLADYQKEI